MRLELMRKTDLALRALTLLDSARILVHAADLAESIGSTKHFVPQVLAPLVRAGWVTSVSGPRGGYRLVANLQERSLLEVIELIEGPTDDGRCVIAGPCQTRQPCAAHDPWMEARAALLKRLAATSVSTVREHESRNAERGTGND